MRCIQWIYSVFFFFCYLIKKQGNSLAIGYSAIAIIGFLVIGSHVFTFNVIAYFWLISFVEERISSFFLLY